MEGAGAGLHAEEVACRKALREHIELRTRRWHVAGDGEQMGEGGKEQKALKDDVGPQPGCCVSHRQKLNKQVCIFKITPTAMVEA